MKSPSSHLKSLPECIPLMSANCVFLVLQFARASMPAKTNKQWQLQNTDISEIQIRFAYITALPGTDYVRPSKFHSPACVSFEFHTRACMHVPDCAWCVVWSRLPTPLWGDPCCEDGGVKDQCQADTAVCSVVCRRLDRRELIAFSLALLFADFRLAAQRDRRKVSRRSRGMQCPANTMVEALFNRRDWRRSVWPCYCDTVETGTARRRLTTRKQLTTYNELREWRNKQKRSLIAVCKALFSPCDLVLGVVQRKKNLT